MSNYARVRPYGPGGGSAAPALTIDGHVFRSHGDRWTSIQCSDFSLFKRYLMEPDIRPILEERRVLGFNDLRVWLLNESVVGQVYSGGIQPSQHPDFYGRLRDFCDLCGSYKFALELTVFTSCIPLMPHRDDQVRHWTQTQDAVRGLAHVRLELTNEYDWGHGENDVHSDLLSMKPVGILASSGSSTADAPPREPVWDYVLYHSNGLNEWQRKPGHNAMEWADHYRRPGHSNENMRCPDDDNNETHFYDAGAGAALLCAGACFHSQSGKYSRAFDLTEFRCADAWVRGMLSVPLEFQVGTYRHHIDMEDHVNKTVLRAYDRLLPDGRAHLVLIRY